MPIEQIGTYKYRLAARGEDWAEVGGNTKFDSVLTLKRWGGERVVDAEAGLSLPNAALDIGPDYIRFGNNAVALRWREVKDAVDFEVVFLRRPNFSSVSLNLNMVGLNAYRQAPLTEMYTPGWSDQWKRIITVTETEVRDAGSGDILEGMFENTVGSLAIYDPRPALHRSDALARKYRTFKAAHIYTPILVDALGNRQRCTLSLVGGTLTVSWPKSWMDAAAYPVTLDPTFGYTSVPTAGYTFLEGTIAGVDATCPEVGTGTKITVSMDVYTAAHNTKCALYNTSSALITNGTTDEVLVPIQSQLWTDFDFTVGPSLTNQVYIICAWSDAAPGGAARIYRDNNVGFSRYLQTATYGAWPDPASFSVASGIQFGSYVTYTTGAAGNPWHAYAQQ